MEILDRGYWRLHAVVAALFFGLGTVFAAPQYGSLLVWISSEDLEVFWNHDFCGFIRAVLAPNFSVVHRV